MIEGGVGPDRLPVATLGVPASDHTARIAGTILIGFGQLHIDLTCYTRCLIAFNKTEKFSERTPELGRTIARFRDESELTFADIPTLRTICRKLKFRIVNAKEVRDRLGHSQLHAVLFDNQPSSLVATFRTGANQERTITYDYSTLEATAQEVGSCHGRVVQLALGTQSAIHRTQPELARLQEIVDTGYWKFPRLPTQRHPPRSPDRSE